MASVLVIDDEVAIRNLLRRALEKQGYEVLDAADGKEGINIFRANPTDLVITDIVMPNQEGMETIQELKQDFPQLKIIAISGGGSAKHGLYLNLAKGFGATSVYDKPIKMDKFLKETKEFLDTREEFIHHA
jgi:DNA-binding NtrC family response regulator